MTNQNSAGETILGKTLDQSDAQGVVDNYVESLVGEGKKYKSVDDLARAYVNADMHIAELREALDELKKKDNSLDEIIGLLRNNSTQPDAPAQRAPADKSNTTIGPEDVTKTVEKVLTEREQRALVAQNQHKSLQLLSEHYGSEQAALVAVKKVINGDAKLREMIDNLGNSNPEALKKFMLSQLPELTEGPVTPGVVGKPSAAAVAGGNKGLTWSDAKRIRKENPKQYNSVDFRRQLEQAAAKALAQGIDFYKT